MDNLIADEQERLFRRTTQVEAPLYLASVLQEYIRFGADAKSLEEIRSYCEGYNRKLSSGVRKEVAMHPNGLLWAQMDRVALSWMNAYINGNPVTERAGYQVETNVLWYNSICFALQMEKDPDFVAKWTPIRDIIKSNFQPVFWCEQRGCLADFVNNDGQNIDVRPNQLIALWVENSPLDDMLQPSVFKVVGGELETRRGIRTLSPRNEKYRGVYDGSQIERPCLSSGQHTHIPFGTLCEGGIQINGPAFYKRPNGYRGLL